MKKHDPEKLLVLFKKSKKVVQAFVDKFQAQHGRKPHGEDLKKKNYVRGNKKMTGQQYKRQQYKSKVNSKFGKSR